jgi:thiamine biosynthesis protein ThiI
LHNMRAFDVALIHYGEISLKGHNRPLFEKRLAENILRATSPLGLNRLRRSRGRLVLNLDSFTDISRLASALKAVFGVSWFAVAYEVEQNLDSITTRLMEVAPEFISPSDQFRVLAKRADKGFQTSSMALNRILGDVVQRATGAKVSLKAFNKEVFVEVSADKAFIFFERVKGLGGLPVGTSGKALALLSGGIDSPVAAWLAMKRGCHLGYVHFHPFSDYRQVLGSKVIDLISLLCRFSGPARLYLVPSYVFQVSTASGSGRHELILFRRFMFKVSEVLAQRDGASALVTGESLAQVASQTLQNLGVIQAGLRLPVLRPLLTYDKQEIVDLAKSLGTYELSIRPYRDCCSIIARHPETRAKLDVIERLEEDLDMNGIVDRTLREVVTLEVSEEGVREA